MTEMADGELDYHITFPTKSSLASSTDEDKSPTEDAPEPVIVLLGWVGCQDKHLSKYSAIYDKRCVTVRYTAPTSDVFYKPSNLRIIAVKILELLADLQLAENPLFFHVFSNGGGFVYRHLTELIHKTKEYGHFKVYGVTFDSCPSQRKLLIAAKAFKTSIGHMNIIIQYIAAAFLLLYLVFISTVQYVKSVVTSGSFHNPRSDDYWTSLKNDPASCPQLFLFSKADEIVGYKSIESFIKYRESRGIRVQYMLWDDSSHVGHLKIHREAYIQQCHRFLDLCLGKDN